MSIPTSMVVVQLSTSTGSLSPPKVTSWKRNSYSSVVAYTSRRSRCESWAVCSSAVTCIGRAPARTARIGIVKSRYQSVAFRKF